MREINSSDPISNANVLFNFYIVRKKKMFPIGFRQAIC